MAQGIEANRVAVTETVRVSEGESWIERRPSAKNQLSIEYQLDYPTASVIGRQVARVIVTPDSSKLASACRTFLLQTEADQLRRQGLGLRVTNRDLPVFDERGPIDNRVRFPNECAPQRSTFSAIWPSRAAGSSASLPRTAAVIDSTRS